MTTDSFTGKKCVVTGGAGFVGSHLARTLKERGADVTVVDLPEARLWHTLQDGVVRVLGDIRDEALMRNTLDGAEYVFHLAALASVPGSIESPREYHDTNVNGTLNVLECVRSVARNARVLFASSASVYGDQESPRAVETMDTRPMSPYAFQKLFGERMLALWSQLYGIKTVSIRPFNIYGEHMNPEGAYAGVVGKFIARRSANEPLTITGDGTQTRDFVHVDDVVSAYAQAALAPTVGAGEAINIASGRSVTVNELARLIGGPVEYVAARFEIKNSEADISRAKELLSYTPERNLEEGIQELLLSRTII